MERQNFDAAVTQLWRYFGLGIPVFGSDPLVNLSLDEFDVVLRQRDDGRSIQVEVEAGRYFLSSGESTVIEGLLKVGAAVNVTNDVIAVLDPGGEVERPRVLVQGFYRYSRNDIAVLGDLVFRAVASAETLQGVLAKAQHPAGTSIGTNAASFDDEACIIFTL